MCSGESANSRQPDGVCLALLRQVCRVQIVDASSRPFSAFGWRVSGWGPYIQVTSSSRSFAVPCKLEYVCSKQKPARNEVSSTTSFLRAGKKEEFLVPERLARAFLVPATIVLVPTSTTSLGVTATFLHLQLCSRHTAKWTERPIQPDVDGLSGRFL